MDCRRYRVVTLQEYRAESVRAKQTVKQRPLIITYDYVIMRYNKMQMLDPARNIIILHHCATLYCNNLIGFSH